MMLWIALLVAVFALLSVAQLFQLSNVPSTYPPVGRPIRARARRGDNETAVYVDKHNADGIAIQWEHNRDRGCRLL
jgi:hypothetical protein